MRYINIDFCKPGMRLGKNLYMPNSTGKKLPILTNNAILTDSIINALKNKGFRGIYIADSLSDDIMLEEGIHEDKINTTISALKNRDVEAVISSAYDIVKEIYGNKNATVDLLRIIDSKDVEAHAMNVCELALNLGNHMGFKQEELMALAKACLLHDIGKYLNKTEIATVEEKIDQRLLFAGDQSGNRLNFLHPAYGYYYLQGFSEVGAISRQAILFSHENENGTGYPFGLNEANRAKLTKYSKILLICDKYEHYLRELGNPVDARVSIQGDYTEGILDTYFTEAFLKKTPIYPAGCSILLSTGEEAIVVKNNKDLPERPVVKTLDGIIYDLSEIKNSSLLISELFVNNQSISLQEERSRRAK